MPDKNIVQSFDRGLAVLAALNVRDGATLRALTLETGLNRTIVYRLLETLSRGGYVRKDRRDGRYWLLATVRRLSDGFGDEAWIGRLIRPQVTALARRFVWPVSFCTPAGTAMLVRVTTDFESPLTLSRFPVGSRVSMIVSAVGQAYLAACEPAHRDAILEAVRGSSSDPAERHALERESFLRRLAGVQRKGYALVGGQKQRISGLAVAVRDRETVVGALALRFFTSAISTDAAVSRFAPDLSETAAGIHKAFSA
jgi:IclR family transcriptional regulator, mhp operon transcriptional activator